MAQVEKQNQAMADEIKRLKAVIIKHENRIRQIEGGPQRDVASGSGDTAPTRPPSSPPSEYHHSNNSSDMAPDEV